MFIKPIDLTALPALSWQDKAGNSHFILQSKSKASASSSIFTTSIASYFTAHKEDDLKKSINEHDFRIILLLPSRRVKFVVAVDESFEKIHTVRKIDLTLKRIGTGSNSTSYLN